MTVRVFGIRHHGPGSARALGASLESWGPDAVLIEGPPEADPVLALAASAEMRPPVALLAYMPGAPRRCSFYPMAAWSPEWVALRHALGRDVPVRMIDLPAAAFLTAGDPGSTEPPEEPSDGPSAGPAEGPSAGHPDERPDAEPFAGEPPAAGAEPFSGDPIAALAGAAGYDDPERWWEDVVEHRGEGEPWEAITDAMRALRQEGPGVGRRGPTDRLTEARREASMRQHIRAAEKEYERVAVVCGAWHAPALVGRGPARPDAELLRGLTRRRATVTWVPWTNSRLSFRSGYGAGVTSPGWYEHLFVSPDRPTERWMAKVAGLLRAEHMDVPPSSVIDAVRLAEALGTMRGRPSPGLTECTDAARAALTGGYEDALHLIDAKLVVGDVIGEIPAATPAVALAADLAAQQRRLRLKPSPNHRLLDLDLRRQVDRERSRLLHRLDLLEIRWGVVMPDRRGTGTFREEWSLGWEPELSVRVVEAGVYGPTVESAATAKVQEGAERAERLATATDLVQRSLLADLAGAVPAVMAALDRRAAVTTDVGELMEALAPLARVLRYGTVRRTDSGPVGAVVSGMVARICVSLGPAAANLDDEAAAVMTARVEAVHAALAALDDRGMRERWLDALEGVAASPTVHGLLSGRTNRLLLDAERLDRDETGRRLAAALSGGEEPLRGAAWVEGLVAGSGLLLVHDLRLLETVDAWLGDVPEDAFDDVLPLLRRSFSGFQPGERRLISAAAARLAGRGAEAAAPSRSAGAAPGAEKVDPDRAALVLPRLRLLLGPHGGSPS